MINRTFHRHSETKNKIRYEEPKGVKDPCGMSVYLNKNLVTNELNEPAVVTITIEAAEGESSYEW